MHSVASSTTRTQGCWDVGLIHTLSMRRLQHLKSCNSEDHEDYRFLTFGNGIYTINIFPHIFDIMNIGMLTSRGAKAM